jgi:hypothetical protein
MLAASIMRAIIAHTAQQSRRQPAIFIFAAAIT